MPRSREILLPWDRQPQEAADVDWNNPLTNGLIFSSSLASGRGFRDQVGGLSPTINGAVTIGATGDGTGAVFSGSDYLDFGASQIIPLGTPFTLTFYEEVTATSSYAAMLGLVAGSRQFLWIRGTSSYVCVLGVADGTTVVKFASMPAQFVGERIRFVLTGDAIDSNSGLRLWANGVEQTQTAGSFGATSASSNKLGWDGADEKFQGRISDLHMLARRWSTEEVKAFFDAPSQLFAPQTIPVPVSAGGGGTTISATPGNAVADGTTASVTRTIPATPGNASADGITASVVRVIGAAPGNTVADGTTAAVTRSIAATPGNAVADGVTATVTNSGTTTISCTPGNAVADGSLAAITRTITAAPGNAVANGAIAALLRVIATTPGNAVADGVTAAVQASVTISCTPGNAVADGVAATVTAAVSQLDLILKILRNRQELNPTTGKFTLYDDDGVTVLYTTSAWADAAGTVPYSGGALRRIDALF